MCYLIYRLYKLCDLVAALGSQTPSSMEGGGCVLITGYHNFTLQSLCP